MNYLNKTQSTLFISFFTFISLCFSQVLLGQEYQEMIAKGNIPLQTIQSAAEKYFENKDIGRGSGYKQWKRWEYDAIRMADRDGYLKAPYYYYQEMARYNKEVNQKTNKQASECISDWTPYGPFEVRATDGYNPGIGRITSIAIDPNDASHIIIGSPTGGVWETKNEGGTWVPLTDFFVNMSVTALAIDPSNSEIFYWGTGSSEIFKSWDSGQNWTQYSTDGNGPINRILVNPNDSTELWISAQYSGLHHSKDGGETWELIISDYMTDIEFHPTDTNIVYASGTELWRSNDAGNIFNTIGTDSIFSQIGPKMMAVSAAAPNNLYVVQAEGGKYEGFYISRDNGETFEYKDQGEKNLFGYDFYGLDDNGQAPRDMDIAVSDIDTNEIFIAGINIWRSLSAGNSFDIVSHWYYQEINDQPYSHADIDILLYNGNQLFIGSDGGLFKMENTNTLALNGNTIKDLSQGLNIHQFYGIGLAQTDPPIVSGGAQDNGSSVFVNNEWRNYFGADGMESFIVNNQEKSVFGTYQGGGLLFSFDLGESGNQLFFSLSDQQGTGRWVTPFEKDPSDTLTFYVAYDTIFKTTDFGFSFEPISQSFRPNHFKIAPTGSDTMYASRGGEFWRTFDGGSTDWTSIADINSHINDITIHPRNAHLVAIATQSKVMITRDGGVSWEEWIDGLPGFQALCVEWQDNDEESLYLGMNYGIFHRDINNKEWVAFNTGMPNVRVNELEINYVTKQIFAGTYGRGLWASPICEPVISSTSEMLISNKLVLSPNPAHAGEELVLQSSKLGQVELRLFNQSGYLVHRNTEVDLKNEYRIKTDHITAGVYYLRVNSISGSIVKKLIIH